MSEELKTLRTLKMSAVIETTEGTAATETDDSAILLHGEGLAWNLDRDLIENNTITGSLSKTKPAAGMWSDDMGPTIPVLMRGIGTKTYPDWSVPMQSIMGSLEDNTDGVCNTGCTTTSIVYKSGATNIAVGQLIYFPDSAEVRRVITNNGTTTLTVWPPLAATPSEDDTFKAGLGWLLTSNLHPSFTAWAYFNGATTTQRLRYDGTKCVNFSATFEVGMNVPMTFVCRSLSPTRDYTAQSTTPNWDTQTVPLQCLGIDMQTVLEGTATGTPTTTQTVLLAPNYEVAVGDKISIDVGSGVYETVAISVVSGNAGSNITLTHAAVSQAASDTDTVYITRVSCANVSDSLELTIEVGSEFEKCMAATYGKTAQKFTERTVTLAKTPYFKSWQEFMMRDDVVGSSFSITLGDTANNIVSIYIPNQIIIESSIGTEDLMRNPTTTRAVIDATLGNDDEIVIGAW